MGGSKSSFFAGKRTLKLTGFPNAGSRGLDTNEVALGNLTGLRMTIQAAGAADLEIGDRIKLTCTDFQPTGKGNPGIDFAVTISRS